MGIFINLFYPFWILCNIFWSRANISIYNYFHNTCRVFSLGYFILQKLIINTVTFFFPSCIKWAVLPLTMFFIYWFVNWNLGDLTRPSTIPTSLHPQLVQVCLLLDFSDLSVLHCKCLWLCKFVRLDPGTAEHSMEQCFLMIFTLRLWSK